MKRQGKLRELAKGKSGKVSVQSITTEPRGDVEAQSQETVEKGKKGKKKETKAGEVQSGKQLKFMVRKKISLEPKAVKRSKQGVRTTRGVMSFDDIQRNMQEEGDDALI